MHGVRVVVGWENTDRERDPRIRCVYFEASTCTLNSVCGLLLEPRDNILKKSFRIG